MLEGLALWALIVYIAVKVFKMPWNKFTQFGSVFGGICWLIFVWIGLISWSPIDMTGGAVVQSPQIQIRPKNSDIKGQITKMHLTPNQTVKKGDIAYEIDDTLLKLNLQKVESDIEALNQQKKNLEISYKVSLTEIDLGSLSVRESQSLLKSKKASFDLAKINLDRALEHNRKLQGSISESEIDRVRTEFKKSKEELYSSNLNLQKHEASLEKLRLNAEKIKISIAQKQKELDSLHTQENLLKWKIESSTVRVPSDGFVSNFMIREGQYVGIMPRLHMYTYEKYVLLAINHQAIRNVKPGQYAEFTTPVYPGKIFAGKVESIVEATGESTGTLLAKELNVSSVMRQNKINKYHFVRVKLDEEGCNVPLGSSGIGWIAAEKPHPALGFLDMIRGMIIRIKSQLHFVTTI